MRLIRQTNENAEIIIASIEILEYNRNKLAKKNTIPE